MVMSLIHSRPPLLDFRHLVLLEVLAEKGTMTSAARQLRVTQSAVSHQLAEIEGRLKKQLFARSTPLKLTAAGRQVLDGARTLLEELRRFDATLAGPVETRHLRVSTGCYTSYHWLPDAIRRFSGEHPEVRVEIALEATRRPVEALLASRLDLAITTDEPVKKRGLTTRALFDDELLALVHPTHSLARKGRVHPRDFVSERLLVYDAPLDELDVWTRFLRPARARPHDLAQVPLTEAIVQLARAGHGVAVLARWIAGPFLAQGGLVALRLGERGLQRTWYAVRRAEDPSRGAIDALASAIQANAPR